MTYANVIVGTDGSGTATNAVRAAAALASALGCPLHLVTAWYRDQPDGPSLRQASDELGGATPASNEASWAQGVSADAAAVGRVSGLTEIVQHTPPGHPAEVLLDLSNSLADPLLVVGTKGLGSATERLLGNVPHSLTHHATEDLFLVARDHADQPSWSSAMLATDGSSTAGLACARGVALADAVGATPTLVTVGSGAKATEALDATATQLGRADIARTVLGSGNPGSVLGERASETDLLVLGNKGMSGPSRLLGSVPNRVTHAVPTDVLLVNTTR